MCLCRGKPRFSSLAFTEGWGGAQLLKSCTFSYRENPGCTLEGLVTSDEVTKLSGGLGDKLQWLAQHKYNRHTLHCHASIKIQQHSCEWNAPEIWVVMLQLWFRTTTSTKMAYKESRLFWHTMIVGGGVWVKVCVSIHIQQALICCRLVQAYFSRPFFTVSCGKVVELDAAY